MKALNQPPAHTQRSVCADQDQLITPFHSIWSIAHLFAMVDCIDMHTAFNLLGLKGLKHSINWNHPHQEVLETIAKKLNFPYEKQDYRNFLNLLPDALHGYTSDKLVESKNLRFCNECIKFGFHSVLHQVKALDNCIIHGTALSGNCSSCEEKISMAYGAPIKSQPFSCIKGHRLCSNSESPGAHRRFIESVMETYKHWTDWLEEVNSRIIYQTIEVGINRLFFDMSKGCPKKHMQILFDLIKPMGVKVSLSENPLRNINLRTSQINRPNTGLTSTVEKVSKKVRKIQTRVSALYESNEQRQCGNKELFIAFRSNRKACSYEQYLLYPDDFKVSALAQHLYKAELRLFQSNAFEDENDELAIQVTEKLLDAVSTRVINSFLWQEFLSREAGSFYPYGFGWKSRDSIAVRGETSFTVDLKSRALVFHDSIDRSETAKTISKIKKVKPFLD